MPYIRIDLPEDVDECEARELARSIYENEPVGETRLGLIKGVSLKEVPIEWTLRP